MNKYYIHRSWKSYRVYKFTFQNLFWKKIVNDPKSKCSYWQRIFWIGSFVVLLHILVLPFRLFFYSLIYRCIVERGSNIADWFGAFLSWAIGLAVLMFFGLEYYFVLFVVALVFGVGLTGIIFFVLFLCFNTFIGDWLVKFFEYFKKILWLCLWPLRKYLRFSWVVLARYYLPQCHLPADKYPYRKYPSGLIHFYFWALCFLIYFIIAYAFTKTGLAPGVLTAAWWTAGILVVYFMLVIISAYFYLRYREFTALQEADSQIYQENSFTARAVKFSRSAGRWLQEKKLKFCPLAEVVD